MKTSLIVLIGLFTFISFGQNLIVKGDSSSGLFSLGVRSTMSIFNDHAEEKYGRGVGGQFRIQFARQINSDWFFDYINSSIGDYAYRTDYHIGWSVLYYPFPKDSFIKPYALAGHCFDYTRIEEVSNSSNYDSRWSSAIQGGLGLHFNFSRRTDISLTGQYMMHLGNRIHAEMVNNELNFFEMTGASLEGHLLVNLSLNYKIGDLW